MTINDSTPSVRRGTVGDVVRTIFPLSWIAFGGPQAHLGILHEHLVDRRHWLDSSTFVELYGMCSILPGPSSTQTVIGLGVIRAGAIGGLAALLVWIFPPVLLMTLFALGVTAIDPAIVDNTLVGIRPAAVALVAVAAWKLGKRVLFDAFTFFMLVFGAVSAIIAPHPVTFPTVLIIAGALGAWLGRARPDHEHVDVHIAIPRWAGAASLAFFAILFVVMNLLVHAPRVAEAAPPAAVPPAPPSTELQVAECFYRNSALIFGGGQVLLPLIQTECVDRNGWVTAEQFGNGLGVIQSLPGPLFAFSAYIGALTPLATDAEATRADQVRHAIIAAAAIFLPAYLLLIGVIPFWSRLRRLESIRRTLVGVNACAVGLVVAAVWMLGREYLTTPTAILIGIAAFIGVIRFRIPAPVAIIGAGVLGYALSGLPL